MKKAIKISLLIVGIAVISCKKDTGNPINPAAPSGDTYNSLYDFYSKNGVPKQTFTVNASTGGSFITPQATTINIPANAFVTQANVPVTGTVAVEFKDIYKKSDMFLSNMGTQQAFGGPLESAGEFFIKATVNNVPVLVDTGSAIVINQPLMPGAVANPSMMPFVAVLDSANNENWVNTTNGAVIVNPSYYIFNLYHFANPVTNGSWCNSDNSGYFSAYPQTNLTLHSTFIDTNYIDVFLIFKNVNSMVHVYRGNTNNTDYPYKYAPLGFQSTAVAIAIKGGKLYASFTPITISNNQTVNFNLTETTTEAFKTALNALN